MPLGNEEPKDKAKSKPEEGFGFTQTGEGAWDYKKPDDSVDAPKEKPDDSSELYKAAERAIVKREVAKLGKKGSALEKVMSDLNNDVFAGVQGGAKRVVAGHLAGINLPEVPDPKVVDSLKDNPLVFKAVRLTAQEETGYKYEGLTPGLFVAEYRVHVDEQKRRELEAAQDKARLETYDVGSARPPAVRGPESRAGEIQATWKQETEDVDEKGRVLGTKPTQENLSVLRALSPEEVSAAKKEIAANIESPSSQALALTLSVDTILKNKTTSTPEVSSIA